MTINTPNSDHIEDNHFGPYSEVGPSKKFPVKSVSCLYRCIGWRHGIKLTAGLYIVDMHGQSFEYQEVCPTFALFQSVRDIDFGHSLQIKVWWPMIDYKSQLGISNLVLRF